MRSIAELLDAFTDAFNRGDLDAVMAAFADDAEYLPGDGKVHACRCSGHRASTRHLDGDRDRYRP